MDSQILLFNLEEKFTVPNEKGKLECERLTSVYESTKSEGYIRDENLPHFRVLKRGNEYLFRPVRRKHRIAATSALGHDYVPVTYDRIAVVDIETAKWWPQVSRGKWSLEKSKKYFDYSFNFYSQKWALERGLVFKQRNEREYT